MNGRHAQRMVRPIAAGVAVATVLALGWLGWALVVGSGPGTLTGASGQAEPEWLTPSAGATSSSLAPSPSRSAKPTPSRTAKPTPKASSSTKRVVAPPKPAPTRKPAKKDLPPAPPTTKPEVCVTPTSYGTNAGDDRVRSALSAAAGRNYWNSGNIPIDLEGVVPDITVPDKLMWAIGYTESSWRSSVVSCDGGIGLMQITINDALDIDTAEWMNTRYGTGYDPRNIDGNAALGAELIEYEIMYFVLNYGFKLPDTPEGQLDFDLDAVAPVGPGGATVKLRDVVISAYNVGIWNVIQTDGSLKIINPTYVQKVKNFMANDCEGRCA